jgi:Leucine-rich repeat (LRR) protein
MENLAGPRLLQAFFEYATDEVLDTLDDQTKDAMRLSCPPAKAFVDGTVTTAAGFPNTLDAILRCDWQLSELCIKEDPRNMTFPPNASSLSALCSKFPMLQVLNINIPATVYDLPANIGQLSKLKDLKINRRYFTALPASFGQLSSLERLELDEFYEPDDSSSQLTIEGLAPLRQLTQLKYLSIDRCLVSKPFFPDWLGSCHFPVLEDLILAGNLQSLPSSIGNFKSLKSLYIEQIRTPEVPESIGSLKLLKTLCIWESDVSLPTSFSKLTTLEDLDVITDMQSFALVEHFHKLTKLHFWQTVEEGVILPYPEFLWTFTSLQKLELSESAVPSLPDALGNLTKLEFLRLDSHQNLEELPESLGDLSCLISFKIEDCYRLIKLPESIGNLKDLKDLEILRCRKVRTLPESIGHLKSLENLYLKDFENFERFPSSIGNLHALKELVGQNCGKVFLPESFADLVLDKPIEECFLKRVSFTGNTKVVNGPRVDLALRVLRERGVLYMYWKNK